MPSPTNPDRLTASNAGTINLQHATIRYPGTAIESSSTTAQLLTSVSIRDSDLALSVPTGSVAFRGSFAGNSQDIDVCDWSSGQCAVDAAYSTWGDGDTGPYPSSGALVCGTVTVSPWLPGDATRTTFADGDCDAQPTPDTQLSSAQSEYSQGLASLEELCSQVGSQDACNEAKTSESCLSGAYELARSESQLSLPSLGGDVAGSIDSDLQNTELQAITSTAEDAGDLDDIIDAAKIVDDLAQAYQSCAP